MDYHHHHHHRRRHHLKIKLQNISKKQNEWKICYHRYLQDRHRQVVILASSTSTLADNIQGYL
jgi:hypothetical protein